MHRISTIECVSEGRNFLVPTETVSQIVEYDVVPLPLARAHIAGIGVRGDDVVVSVTLTDRPPPTQRRTVTAALLVTKESGTRWAIEISHVLNLVDAYVQPSAAQSTQPAQREGLAERWLAEVTTRDGRKLPLFDVRHLLTDLSD